MCLKGFLFNKRNFKKSIKIKLKKFKNKEIFRRECGEEKLANSRSSQISQRADHKYDLNCSKENCAFHPSANKNAYSNFIELFFTKPIELKDFFHEEDCPLDKRIESTTNANENTNCLQKCKACSLLPIKVG